MESKIITGILSVMDNLILKIKSNDIKGKDIEVKWLYEYLKSHVRSLLILGDSNNGQFLLLNKIFDCNAISDDVLLMGTSVVISLSNGVSIPLILKSDGKILQLDSNNMDLDKILSQIEISEIILPYPIDLLAEKSLLATACSISDIKSADIFKLYKVICSDSIIFTINATQAFSIAQKDLLKSIYDINGANVLIAVTGLELIREKEKSTVIDFIKKAQSVHSPSSKIIFIDSNEENEPETTIRNIKKIIADSLTDEHVINQRINTVQKRVLFLIDECESILVQRKNELVETLANMKNKDEMKKESILASKQGWEELRIEFEKRANNCLEYIYGELQHAKLSISEQLHFELSKSNNPKEWWSKDLPFRLKKEFENHTRGMEKQLQVRIIGDYKWLTEKARNYYARNVPMSDNIDSYSIDKTSIDIIPKAEELKDLKLIRYITMAGTGTASVVMWFIVGPLGAIVSAAGGIIGDRYINKEIQNQQERLNFALDQLIDGVIDKAKYGISQRVYDGYDSIVQTTVVTEENWEKDVRIGENKQYKEEQEILIILKEIEEFKAIKSLIKQ